MSPTKFIIMVIGLYMVSLLVSVVVENRVEVFSWAGLFVLSLILFSFLFIVVVVLLAIIYALVKKPLIEKGSYRLERIKGKRD